ncbi:hypothetical protein SteCoe_29051 [Stentor coeruleus]|uniref:Uncharacterized protein n=1 Tax=Stentor coeruleus TaxID=5963 RepID=A0A1R2B6U8_9CILI|nr:hypothetical protein SteCoe_29051 [Stentor coeruleus]
MSARLKKEQFSIPGKPEFKLRIRFQDKTNAFFSCIIIGMLQMLIRHKNQEIFNRIKATFELYLNPNGYWKDNSHITTFKFIYDTILGTSDIKQALDWLSYYSMANENNYKNSIVNAGQVIVYAIMGKYGITDFNNIDIIFKSIAESLTIVIKIIERENERTFVHPELDAGPILYLGIENEYIILLHDDMNNFDESLNYAILNGPSLMYRNMAPKKTNSVPSQPFIIVPEPMTIIKEKKWKDAPNVSLFEFNSNVLEKKIKELFKRFLSEEETADLFNHKPEVDPRSPEVKMKNFDTISQNNFNPGLSSGRNINESSQGINKLKSLGTENIGGPSNFTPNGMMQGFQNNGLLPDSRNFQNTGLSQQNFPNNGMMQGLPNTGLPQGPSNTGLPQGPSNTGLPQGPSNTGLPQGFPNTGLPQGLPQGGPNTGLPQTGLPQGFSNTGLPQGPSTRLFKHWTSTRPSKHWTSTRFSNLWNSTRYSKP